MCDDRIVDKHLNPEYRELVDEVHPGIQALLQTGEFLAYHCLGTFMHADMSTLEEYGELPPEEIFLFQENLKLVMMLEGKFGDEILLKGDSPMTFDQPHFMAEFASWAKALADLFEMISKGYYWLTLPPENGDIEDD